MVKGKKPSKVATKEKQMNRPPKPKYTYKAHFFYKETIAPLERAYRQAMGAGNYIEASKLFNQITAARQEHRLWLARKEKVRIR